MAFYRSVLDCNDSLLLLSMPDILQDSISSKLRSLSGSTDLTGMVASRLKPPKPSSESESFAFNIFSLSAFCF